MLTNFESFDTLAGPSREPTEVVPVVYRLACAAPSFSVSDEIR